MKRQYVLKTVSAILCLVTIFITGLFSGCDNVDKSVTAEIPIDAEHFSLSDMWEKVAAASDLQKNGAELGDFHMRIGEDGKIDSLYFTFSGWNKKGRPSLYFASLGRGNKITVLEYETKSFTTSKRPQYVFEQIDRIGLAGMKRGDEGLTIHIDFQWGDIGFSHDYIDIFQLQDIDLLPLKRLIFHTNSPFCTITIQKNFPSQSKTTTTITTMLSSSAIRTVQIWFLSEDINKAETVEYLD